jgi:chromosome segregation ATPase
MSASRESRGGIWRAALFALVLVAAPALRAADPAPPEHLDAYVQVVQADQARDRGDFKAAVRAYRDALTLYAKLAREKPEWNPESVRFRMTYCAGEIEKVLRQTGKTEEQILSEPDISAGGELAAARAMYLSLLKEHETLKEQFQTMKTEHAAARQMLGDSDASMRRMGDEKRAMEAEVQAAREAGVATLRQSSNRIDELTADVGHLEAELVKALDSARLATEAQQKTEMERRKAQQDAESLRAEAAKPRPADMTKDRDLAALREKLAAADRDAAALREKLSAADRDLAAGQTARAELQRRLEARPVADDGMARQLDELREQLRKAGEEAVALRAATAAVPMVVAAPGSVPAPLIAGLEAQLAAASQELSAVRDERETLLRQLAAASNSPPVANESDTAKKLRQENEALKVEVGRAGKTALALRQSLDFKDAELAKMNALRAEAEAARAAREKAEDDAKRLQRELDRALNENRVAKLEKLVGELRGQVESAQAVQAAAEKKARDLERRVPAAPPPAESTPAP